jgi:hypothetical protein
MQAGQPSRTKLSVVPHGVGMMGIHKPTCQYDDSPIYYFTEYFLEIFEQEKTYEYDL